MQNILPTEDLKIRFSLNEEQFDKIMLLKIRPEYFWTISDNQDDALICCAIQRRDLYTEEISDAKKIYTKSNLIFKNKEQTLILKNFCNISNPQDTHYVGILLENMHCVIDD